MTGERNYKSLTRTLRNVIVHYNRESVKQTIRIISHLYRISDLTSISNGLKDRDTMKQFYDY